MSAESINVTSLPEELVGVAETAAQARFQLAPAHRATLSLIAIDGTVGLLATLAMVIFAEQLGIQPAVVAIWMAVWLAMTALQGGYRSQRELSVPPLRILRVGVIASLVSVAVPVLLGFPVYLSALLVFMATVSAFGGAGRSIFGYFWRPRSIVLSPAGAGVGLVAQDDPHARVVELSESDDADPAALAATVSAAAREFDASHVVIPLGAGLSPESLRELSWALRKRHVSLRLAIDAQVTRPDRVRGFVSGRQAVLDISAPEQTWLSKACKRAFDIVGASVLVLLVSPVLLAATIMVKASGPGSILYRQVRIGKGAEPFTILKFRSMTPGADSQLGELLAEQRSDNQPLFKVTDDPRITKVGKFLRRSSIDELPQLFNVIGGSMSLVGPRPQREAEVTLYEGSAVHRLGVRPGITGLWQVSGRSRLNWEQAQQFDIEYAHNWSIRMDLSILARTAKAVATGDGAQ